MISQKKYWDKKIKEWSSDSYSQKSNKTRPIEKLANLFRGPIVKRMEIALQIAGPKAKGKVIADFGCGLGDYCFKVLRYDPKKVIGLDISEVAVKEASNRAKKMGLKNVIFVQTDIGQAENLPEFDIAVGLGFIDYLDQEELKKLFKSLSNRYFLFSVFEKKLSLRNLIHGVYVKMQKCPGAFKYSKAELIKIIPKKLKANFLEKDKLLFITNLSANNE